MISDCFTHVVQLKPAGIKLSPQITIINIKNYPENHPCQNNHNIIPFASQRSQKNCF